MLLKNLAAIILRHGDNKAQKELLKQLTELCGRIEVYKRNIEKLNLHMKVLILDYDAIKQELLPTKVGQNRKLQINI